MIFPPPNVGADRSSMPESTRFDRQHSSDGQRASFVDVHRSSMLIVSRHPLFVGA